MKKFLLSVSTLFFCLTQSKAQSFSWVHEETSSGCVICKDASDKLFSSTSQIIVKKCNADGQNEFTTAFGGSGQFMPASIVLDPQNNIYVCGSLFGQGTFGSTSLNSGQNYEMVLVKADASGNILWAKDFDGSDFSFASGMAVDANGAIYITGNFSGTKQFGNISLTSSGNSDVFVAKFDANGDAQWAVSGGSGSSDNARAIAISKDGLYVAGIFSGFAKFGNLHLNGSGSSSFVWKLDLSGNTLSAFAAAQCSVMALCSDTDGNILAGGNFTGDGSFGGISMHTTNTDGDAFVAKLNSTGNAQWIFTGSATNGYSYVDGISTDKEGNSYLAGGFQGNVKFDNSALNPIGENDAFVAQLSTHGNLKWVKTGGGPGEDNMAMAIPTADEQNLFIAGNVQDGPIHFGNIQLQGNFSGEAISGKMAGTFTGLTEQATENNALKIYPNPSAGAFTIETGSALPLSVLTILDITGKVVLKYDLEGKQTININALPKGIYTVKIQKPEGVLISSFLSVSN
jgi:hypothetical protein